MPNWEDPAVRQAVLENVHAEFLSNPLYALSRPGLPSCHLNWRNADKFAYAQLLIFGKDPEGVAKAFNLVCQPPDEARIREDAKKVKGYAAHLSNTFPDLQRILRNFESLIRSRWNKKSEAERIKLIRDAEPLFPKAHRSDLRGMRGAYNKANFVATEIDFTHPHINAEDLAKGNTFLRLLNTRGRNEPADFAICDLDTVQVGVRFNVLTSTFLAVGVDLSSNVSTGRYGAIYKTSRTNIIDIIDAVVSQRMTALNDALFVLKIQARLVRFLKTCCEKILHDKLELLSADLPAEADPGPLPDHDEETRSALAVALQRPYRHPRATVDFQDMLRQARAALEDGKEHIWALREDPSYFSAVVNEFKDHSMEYIQDRSGREHRDVELPNQGFLNMVMQKMLHQVYKTVFDWELITSLLEQVVEQEPKFVKTGVQFEEDDTDFYRLLLRLRLAFDEVMLPDTIKRLCQNLMAGPYNRVYFRRRSTLEKTAVFKADVDMFDDQLFFLLVLGLRHVNADPEEQPPFVGTADILLEIQRFVDAKEKGKLVLSTLAVQTIADAGLQADMRSQLSNYRPRVFSLYVGPGFESVGSGAGVFKKALLASVWSIHSTATKLRREVLENARFPNLAPYADTSRGLFQYPAHQKRTKANTAVMQTAEANLDIFWREFDNFIKESDSGLWQKIQDLSLCHKLVRTPDWVEPAVKGGATRGEAAASSSDLIAPFGGLSMNPSETRGKSSLARDAGEKKDKIKSRGKADPSKAREPAAQQQTANVAEQAPNTIFRVSGRAMEVVDMIFHQPSTHTPGELHWADFLHTMTSVGFAAQPMFGSAVSFTPTGELLGLWRQSIMLHAPHPSKKMDWRAARRIGRRLTRNYGLDASWFEQE